MDVTAVTRYVRLSPSKARDVVRHVQGLPVDEAIKVTEFSPKKAAAVVGKTLKSAVANAEENLGLAREDLYIAEAYVDGGPTRRWRRFGARGRFKPLLRRSSHITIILEEYEYE